MEEIPEVEEPAVPEVVAERPPQAPLQREGPLVLRINQLPPQPAPQPAPAVPDPPRNGRRNRQAPPPARGNAQRGNARGGQQGRGGGMARNRAPRNQHPTRTRCKWSGSCSASLGADVRADGYE